MWYHFERTGKLLPLLIGSVITISASKMDCLVLLNIYLRYGHTVPLAVLELAIEASLVLTSGICLLLPPYNPSAGV